ncbi:MAG: ribosome biogenesis GTP-binding protein YihA/YsxC [Bacteroidetes bacterium]|nr:ribosome biogenesis GTP-binding protein YihA/YsxC [Bacteroidota bacterium]
MEINTSEYLQSVPTVAGCPKPDKEEFAFVGRSNVGKSSLINMLTGRKSLALTSHTPGKTQTINHFLINKIWYLVDLPGYGYAKRSKTSRLAWQINMEEYLTQRENLTCVFLLIDANIKPQEIDLEFADWLGENSVPFCIIFTKSDKSKSIAIKKNIEAFFTVMAETWMILPQHFVTSANKKTGRKEVLGYIEELCAK